MSNSQFDPNQGQPYTNPTRKQAQEAPQGAARSDEQGLSGVTHTGGGSSPVTDVKWNRMSWHQRQAYLATLDRARRALDTQIVVHRPRSAPLPPGPFGSRIAGILLFGFRLRNSGVIWSFLPKSTRCGS